MLTASLVYAAAFVGWLVSGRLQQLALVTHHVFAQQVSRKCLLLAVAYGCRES